MRTLVYLFLLVASCLAAQASASDPPQPLATRGARYEPAQFADLPDWQEDDPRAAVLAFRRGCEVVGRRASFRRACDAVRPFKPADAMEARAFFEANFAVFRVFDRGRVSGGESGLLTGYFEPLLLGSLVKTPRFRYPLYAIPDDLLYLDLREPPTVPDAARDATVASIASIASIGTTASIATVARFAQRQGVELTMVPAGAEPFGLAGSDYYELALPLRLLGSRSSRTRVRAEGHEIVPYFSRAEIDQLALDARVIAWVDHPVAVYVLHVQGSGRVRLPNGRIVRIGYAEQNGHPFIPKKIPSDHPIAKAQLELLVAAAQAAGQMPRGARAARLAPPDSVELRYAQTIAVGEDPSYIFFRELPDNLVGPIGALGVPLTAERSIAVDPRSVPLGVPVFVAATRTLNGERLNRLAIAQDVGGAIRGPVRADFFWGFGAQAGLAAMRTPESLTKWVLLPNGFLPSRPLLVRQPRGPARLVERECVLADDAFCTES